MLAEAKPSSHLWTPNCETEVAEPREQTEGAELRETDGGWRKEEEVETNCPATFISPSPE